ncbi:MAG: alpha/beta hydrolase [Planctomycetota bacterium]
MKLSLPRFLLAALFLVLLAVPSAAASGQPRSGAGMPVSFSAKLSEWLQQHPLTDAACEELARHELGQVPLTADESRSAAELLWASRRDVLRKERQAEMDAREIVLGDLRMPFWYRTFGEAPADGRSLYISMHGGGGAPAAVNDQQYENQKRLYQPAEGIYLVPRAPTNTWNLWHEQHIDDFFDRLIVNLTVFENVNPNRVYLMGYSAGGDGVYQLAPRLADRLAAAAMMAGHPNESRPEGLRNIGFTLHMGANDGAYNRNTVAAEWGRRLKALQDQDPQGYAHEVTLHEGLGHWMQLRDAVAVPWMAKFQRSPWPVKVVWVQDDVRHSRFYWLRTNAEQAKAGDEITAEVIDGAVRIRSSSADELTLLLSDRLVSLDSAVSVIHPNGMRTEHSAARTAGVLAAALRERSDLPGMYSAVLKLQLQR